MKIKNFKTGEIKDCDTVTYSDDMSLPVTCPECGKRTTFGNLYNTGDWFNLSGIWRVCICKDCAERIWKEEEEEYRKHAK